MSNQLLTRRKAGHPSSRTTTSKKLAAMSAWICLASTATNAFSTMGFSVARKSLLQTRNSPLARHNQRHGSRPFSTGLSRKATELSIPSETDTESYDVVNNKKGLEKYDPGSFETEIYRWWESAGCFEPDAKQKQGDGKEPYVIPMPPPNVTGRLHMGHAIFVALQDVLARFHRMRGRPVLWLPGGCDFNSSFFVHT